MIALVLASQLMSVASGMCLDGSTSSCTISGCAVAQRECVDGYFTPCACEQWSLQSSTYAVPAPVYVVVSVVYAPSGAGSRFAYAEGSTMGSRFGTFSSTGSSSSVGISIRNRGAGLEFSSGTVTGASSAIFKTSTHAVAVQSQRDVDPSHDADLFVVWVNPRLRIDTYYGAGGVTYAWEIDPAVLPSCPGGDARFAVLPQKLIKSPGLAPAGSCEAAFLARLSAAGQAAELLGHSPFGLNTTPSLATWTQPGEGTAGSGRFQRVQLIKTTRTVATDGKVSETEATTTEPYDVDFRIAGPAASGLAIPALATSYKDTTCGSHTQGATAEVTASTLHVRHIFASGSDRILRYGYLATTWQCATQAAGVLLQSSTVGCKVAGRVWLDRMFGTFITEPTSESGCAYVPP